MEREERKRVKELGKGAPNNFSLGFSFLEICLAYLVRWTGSETGGVAVRRWYVRWWRRRWTCGHLRGPGPGSSRRICSVHQPRQLISQRHQLTARRLRHPDTPHVKAHTSHIPITINLFLNYRKLQCCRRKLV